MFHPLVIEFVLFLLQPAPSGGGGGGASPVEAAGGGEGDGMGGWGLQLLLLGGMLVAFYFFMFRPEQKRRREQEALLNSIVKGTKVRTTGGLLGEVISVVDDEVVMEIQSRPPVRINVLKMNIAGVESARKAALESARAAAPGKKDDPKAPEKAEKVEKTTVMNAASRTDPNIEIAAGESSKKDGDEPPRGKKRGKVSPSEGEARNG